MIGEALRLIRVFHDRKQLDLAKELGISQSYLSDLERGEKSPSQDLVARYATIFNVPVSSIWFFDEKLESGAPATVIKRSRGVVADKILDFLKVVEARRGS